MRMDENGSALDPLRVFEMDQEDWDSIKRSVVAEGPKEWEDWVPTIIAAIEEGYLDSSLQMVAKWLRDRYLFLKNTGALAPAYAPAVGVAKVESNTPPLLTNEYISAINPDMVPASGIAPMMGNESGTPYFTARGFKFRKSDFIGKHFVSPVPVTGGALFRIDKVNRSTFDVTVVAVNELARRGSIGRTHNFDLQKQYRIYDLPKN